MMGMEIYSHTIFISRYNNKKQKKKWVEVKYMNDSEASEAWKLFLNVFNTFSTNRSCFGSPFRSRTPLTPRAPKENGLKLGLNVHDVNLVVLQPFGIDLNVPLAGRKTQLVLCGSNTRHQNRRVLQQRFPIKKKTQSLVYLTVGGGSYADPVHQGIAAAGAAPADVQGLGSRRHGHTKRRFGFHWEDKRQRGEDGPGTGEAEHWGGLM